MDNGDSPVATSVLARCAVVDVEAITVDFDPVAVARAALLRVAPRALGAAGAVRETVSAVAETCPALKELRLVTLGYLSPNRFYEAGGLGQRLPGSVDW